MSLVLCLALFAQPSSFRFSDIPTPQTAGDSFRISVTARDRNGNLDPYTGPAELTTSRDGAVRFIHTTRGDNIISFSSGLWEGFVYVTLADTLTLRCSNLQRTVWGTSNQITVDGGRPVQLLPVLPGETHVPGSARGRLGDPARQTAGTSFNLEVYVTDTWFNRVRNRGDSVYFFSTDSFALLPQGGRLTDGYGTFAVTLRASSDSQQITVRPQRNSPLRGGVSSYCPVVPGSFQQLLLLLPGETPLPGDTTTDDWNTPGKAGAPNAQYVGRDFDVKVYACDACWNPVDAPSESVSLGSDFPFESSPRRARLGKEAVFSTRFQRAGTSQNIRAATLDRTRVSYTTWFDVRALATLFEITAPDTVRAGETAYIHVTLKDANLLPVVAAACRFAVVAGTGDMLDSVLLSDTLGRVKARFLCIAARGPERDTVKISAAADTFISIYVDRPDSSVIGVYPNPFGFNRESATIYYFLRAAAKTWVRIYDPFGNEVRTWHSPTGGAYGRNGMNYVQWDGRNTQGRRVANGIYVIQVVSEMHTGIAFRRACRVGVMW